MSSESVRVENALGSAQPLPGTRLGKCVLIVVAVVTIPFQIGTLLSAEDLTRADVSLRSNRAVTSAVQEVTALQVSSIRLTAIIGLATNVLLLALAFAIDSYPLPALLAASSLYLGRCAASGLVLPFMPWGWAWLLGFAVFGVVVSGCAIRALLAQRARVRNAGTAPVELPLRAIVAYLIIYGLVLVIPVLVFANRSPSESGMAPPLDYLAVSAVNSAVIALPVLCAILVVRLPRLRASMENSRKAWTVAPLATIVLGCVAVVYQYLLSNFLPLPADSASLTELAHLLFGLVVVSCAAPALVSEWIFRRLALTIFGSLMMSVRSAIIVSAVMFAATHVLTPLNMPLLFALGIILGWAYVQTGRLVLPILLHFAFNVALLTIGAIWQ